MDNGIFTDEGECTRNAKCTKNVAFKVLKVALAHKSALENKMNCSKLGIYPAQHRILITLSHNTRISQKELARILRVSPATITVSIKKLVKEGYIVKENMMTDNRFNILQITEKGKKVIEKSETAFEEIDSRMLTGFSAEEIEQVSGMLQRMFDNLSK